MLRTFIAIPVSSKIRLAVIDIVDKFSVAGKATTVRWVKPEHLHLTLSFLGEMAEEMVDPILNIMEEVAQRYEPFKVLVGGLGGFPSLQCSTVIWLGVSDDDSGSLFRIAGSLKDRLRNLGFAMDNRSFKPHITIGRCKTPISLEDLDVCDFVEYMMVNRMCLYESRLGPAGPAYILRGSANLR